MEPGPSSRATVLFRSPNRLTAEEKSVVRRFARELSERITGSRAFTCVITDDRELQSLNAQFLEHDYPTDVLSFPAPEPSSAGDLAISYDRARAQAREFGHSIADEIRLLMLHGVLHLVGYDHESDQGAMQIVEQKWRAEFKLPPPLTVRSGAVR